MFFKKKSSASSTTFDFQDKGREGHTLISSGTHIQGDIRFSGLLRVDGRIDGKIQSHDGKKGTLILSRSASINGPVRVTDVVADGIINGNVHAEGRVELRNHAVITGEVHYGTLSIADGASIEGRCMRNSQQNVPFMAQRRKAKINAMPEPASSPHSDAAKPAAVATFLKKQ